jgi:hypothetical protein
MTDESVTEKNDDPFTIFPEQVRLPIIGLSFLGHLDRDVSFCGHSWTLKTLRPGEKAAIAVAVQPWRETLIEPVIYANAHVAMAITAVDGDTNFQPPIGPDINDFARTRLNVVTDPLKGWFQPTLDYLYSEYLSLEEEAIDAIAAMRNLSQANPSSLESFVNSSAIVDTSNDETPGDSPS